MKNKYSYILRNFSFLLGKIMLLVITSNTLAEVNGDKDIIFKDIVSQSETGIDYRNTGTPRQDIVAVLQSSPIPNSALFIFPLSPDGMPGVALLDYDGDGDLDIYAANGPGTANSLYANQLKDSGELRFIDVAGDAGVAVLASESHGVCYGDIDNDGDLDLYVLNLAEDNVLFENQGDGTFANISVTSNTGGDAHNPSSCSMGDINNDGLLDIAVANTTITWDNSIALAVEPYAYNQFNQLFVNTGGNTFDDVSTSSGIQDLKGIEPGQPTITWAIAMVDHDLDGDVDIIMADDQGPLLPAIFGGVDRGILHIMENDGSGHFSDVNVEAGVNTFGTWMGLSFGDFNSDGHMDFFGSNLGDYLSDGVIPAGFYSSRWFLGSGSGVYTDSGLGNLVATTFGWGTVTTDYDNDGDTDITYAGGLNFGPFLEATPTVILENDGDANFTYDLPALAETVNHTRRSVKGLASGDLNGDGFVDMVSVSNYDIEDDLTPHVALGAAIDSQSAFLPLFTPINDTELAWTGNSSVDGSLTVELNSADNGNHWVAVDLIGTKDLTRRGRANRSGIGAVVNFTPKLGKTVMRPVLGGASYSSQDSLTAHFGLGKARKGTIDILWPGGVRNRLYNVRASEKITFPEIPCSYDSEHFRTYKHCVKRSLRELHKKGIINRYEKYRFFHSAMRAFRKE